MVGAVFALSVGGSNGWAQPPRLLPADPIERVEQVAADAERPAPPPLLRRDKAATFARVRAMMPPASNELFPVIVEVDVPAYAALRQGSMLAKGSASVARADAQLATAIHDRVQAELAKLAGTAHVLRREFTTIPFVAMSVSREALDRLERSPGVLGVEEDRLARPMLDESTVQVGATAAWARGFDGSGLYVAILDTGVFTDHEFFAGKDMVEACFALGSDGMPGVGDCPNGASTDIDSPHAAQPYPSNFGGFEHGTHVAGIAVGNGPGSPAAGVARGANLIAIQVFSKFPQSTACDPAGQTPMDCLLSFSSDQIAALEYLFSLRDSYDIASANMSLGGGAFGNQADCDNANAAEKAAIDNLRSIGAATAIAAGNETLCGAVAAPGCISSAVAVGAVNDTDSEAGFSNYEPDLLDLYAPGVGIISSTVSPSTYWALSGTSMATPHVAGTWAVMRQALPAESVDFILNALQTTGAPVFGRCDANPPVKRIQIDAALDLFAPQVRACQLTELVPSDVQSGAEFGAAVAIDGTLAAVGARSDDCTAGTRCGAVYAYRWNGTDWIEEQKLTASDPGAVDKLGFSVDAAGDVIAAGAAFDDLGVGSDAGSVYVFRYDGILWAEEQKLTASDAAANDQFGTSVSAGADMVLVGAPNEGNSGGSDGVGAAYVFAYDGVTWSETQKLTASDAPTSAKFGTSVDLDGNVAVVGAPSTPCAAGSNCGSAYVYRFDGVSWVEEQILGPSDAAANLNFGFAVSVSGSWIMVGAPFASCTAGTFCGAIYVFHWNGTSWVQDSKLQAWDADASDLFGTAVSLSGETALAGAFSNDCADGINCGSAYVLRRDASGAWFVDAKLFSLDLAALDQFGAAVALDGSLAIVGVRGRDPSGLSSAGSVFAYGAAPDCNANSVADLCDILSGTSADTDQNGQPDECACFVGSAPQPDVVDRRNRYLTFTAGDAGRLQAIRVTMTSLPAPFDTFNGTTMWVGDPVEVSENSGVAEPAGAPGFPTFQAAPLVCDPVFRDWSLVGPVHVHHELIVPGATYDVQVIGAECNPAVPGNYSPPLTVATPTWGDVVGTCAVTPCSNPDDSVDVTTDVTAVLSKFKNTANAPGKSRADLEPSGVDFLVNISDVTRAMDGFRGSAYPFPPPSSGPCP
ncbi:MAG: hypothetical protein D6788_09540 [Planctomycetota bacterium]|nr:MAG: hypothetical protein D6788_09540 [Planctomycetota bacterium]